MNQNPYNAFFTINTFTKNDNLTQILEGINDLCTELSKTGITKNEIDKAKSYFKGNLPIRYETPMQKADFLYTASRYNMKQKEAQETLIKLLDLTVKDVNIFINNYFQDNPFQIMILTDYQEVKDLLDTNSVILDKVIRIQ